MVNQPKRIVSIDCGSSKDADDLLHGLGRVQRQQTNQANGDKMSRLTPGNRVRGCLPNITSFAHPMGVRPILNFHLF
jgi:hypothetical protein